VAESRQINPAGLGPQGVSYSQGVVAGDFLFVAGQVGFDENDELVGKGDVAAQTRRTLERVRTVLKEAGAELSDLVSANVFLKDIGDFREFDSAWREVMGDHRPARATVEAPMVSPDILVEIQAVAYIKR
jgi:2-iminobutanoate/2-iminopropanoate deaminase